MELLCVNYSLTFSNHFNYAIKNVLTILISGRFGHYHGRPEVNNDSFIPHDRQDRAYAQRKG